MSASFPGAPPTAEMITGRWEQSDDGTQWEPDFDLTYTRVAG